MVSQAQRILGFFIDLAERGVLPDSVLRWGIRGLNRQRLRKENRQEIEAQSQALQHLLQEMRVCGGVIYDHYLRHCHTLVYDSVGARFRSAC